MASSSDVTSMLHPMQSPLRKHTNYTEPGQQSKGRQSKGREDAELAGAEAHGAAELSVGHPHVEGGVKLEHEVRAEVGGVAGVALPLVGSAVGTSAAGGVPAGRARISGET